MQWYNLFYIGIVSRVYNYHNHRDAPKSLLQSSLHNAVNMANPLRPRPSEQNRSSEASLESPNGAE